MQPLCKEYCFAPLQNALKQNYSDMRIHMAFLIMCSQDGQNPGPPPLIPGLGQQGGQGRLGPHNQGPGLNKGN